MHLRGLWAAALVLAPAAAAHGLVNLGVVVPAECPEAAACLARADPRAPLHAGDRVSFFAYNDDADNHTLHVAPGHAADPDGRNTSPSRALASSGPLSPNASRDAGGLAVPADAGTLYVWCSRPGHEAAGEALRVPIEPPEADASPVPGLGPVLAVGSLAVAALLRRTGAPATETL